MQVGVELIVGSEIIGVAVTTSGVREGIAGWIGIGCGATPQKSQEEMK